MTSILDSRSIRQNKILFLTLDSHCDRFDKQRLIVIEALSFRVYIYLVHIRFQGFMHFMSSRVLLLKFSVKFSAVSNVDYWTNLLFLTEKSLFSHFISIAIDANQSQSLHIWIILILQQIRNQINNI